MKKIILAFLALSFVFSSCLRDEVVTKYTFYRPVYKTSEQARAEIKSYAPVEIIHPGKIYYKDGYVFLNELQKGIHVIDIRNVQQPTRVGFIKIPGCVDMAVRGTILYADMFTDLIALDISNPLDVKRTQIVEGAFPENYYNGFLVGKDKVITEWIRVDTTVLQKDYVSWMGRVKAEGGVFALAGGDSRGGISNGTGGSMARFALNEDRLYTVSHSDLKVFNVSNPEKPAFVKSNPIGWNIETIFPYGKNLFIGSMSGMYIFDVSNKDNPVQKSVFEHARVCDPVIADGNFAYVTLRNGTECLGFINQLDVVDVTDLTKPKLIKSFPMTNPHGLSKDGDLLMICDGKDGLRFLDAKNPRDVRTIHLMKGMNTFDVIAIKGIAIVTAEDGLYFIDYKDPFNPKITSSFKINI
ncbi:MAG: LVIVD repeat-containing protein [Sphingobacteriales bacterium]|jgi:hypothetical protein